MADSSASTNASRWAETWPDVLAFVGGLAVAWYAGWQTTDLVWSLWLSSLVVGYSMIVWTIFGPLLVRRFGFAGQSITVGTKQIPVSSLSLKAYLGGGLFLLAFFTFHFGMFHFVHSVFVGFFFPVFPNQERSGPALAAYAEVVRRYWIFLPLAFLAERKGFQLPAPEPDPESAKLATVEPPTFAEAETEKAEKKKRDSEKAFGPGGIMAPYKNVIRLHLLIFFFAFAHFLKFENFLVYAVVYAVYFLPWKLFKKRTAG